MTSGGVDPAAIEVDRPRDEVGVGGEVLDDVLGAPDEGGFGPLDAVLLFGGAGAVIAGLTSLAPMPVVIGGAIAFCLGAVLPLRSLRRRAATRPADRCPTSPASSPATDP